MANAFGRVGGDNDVGETFDAFVAKGCANAVADRLGLGVHGAELALQAGKCDGQACKADIN